MIEYMYNISHCSISLSPPQKYPLPHSPNNTHAVHSKNKKILWSKIEKNKLKDKYYNTQDPQIYNIEKVIKKHTLYCIPPYLPTSFKGLSTCELLKLQKNYIDYNITWVNLTFPPNQIPKTCPFSHLLQNSPIMVIYTI